MNGLMGIRVKFTDLGLIDFSDAYDIQKRFFHEALKVKMAMRAGELAVSPPQNHLIFCEHPHVFTLGISGKRNNLLIDDKHLKKINASFIVTDRGGDITYHGPGQLVVYPIFDLEQFHISVKEYIYLLEESIICLLKEYNIYASRLKGAAGVWLEPDSPLARKICAIGVRTSRYITMHGLALNVNTDLKYFSHINPCGFRDKSVTCIRKELGMEINTEDIKGFVKRAMENCFETELY